MTESVETSLDHIQNFTISSDIGAWVILWTQDHILLHDRRVVYLTNTFETRNSNLLVSQASQPVWVDDGLIRRIRGRDGNVSAGNRCDKCRGQGSILVLVSRRTSCVILLISEIGPDLSRISRCYQTKR